ncbi:MAG TPA: FAD-dependent oxidoreductase, partial [Steroidobacteraceae bacterium]|nr:FAD-dependent oxidoreductase [Steroidobacteraceae bacterium]
QSHGMTRFPHLFRPLRIRGCTLKNRIMSTGHDTTLPVDGTVNAELVAYQEARARGGVGLIVLQVSGVHETARYTNHVLMATSDAAIEGYRRVAEAVHRHGTVLFGQLFHPGREIAEADGGLLSVAYAPSSVPNERFRVMPRPLKPAMIASIVQGYGDAARRMQTAGFDGVEIVASHGYLPAQFLNPRVNLRVDAYGGDLDGRLRFLREVIADIRAKVTDGFVVGLRISGSEVDEQGLAENEVLEAVTHLSDTIDYVHITLGTSASLGGAIHIAPPMTFTTAYVVPHAARIKERVRIPVFVTGRINQPQDAEAAIAGNHADVCGMTRALICDPDMPNKAARGAPEDIRACIACNQACIGHFHKGYPISCIQNPVSGRELRFGTLPQASPRKKVMIVGGGPAGMKAAVIATQRGHSVTLYEAERRLGGQALLAQMLPGRAEFGGLITNLERELELAGVQIHKGRRVDRAMIAAAAPDVVLIATGARPYRPDFPQEGALQIVDAWQVLRNQGTLGQSVVVIDWRADWIGIGIAEHLAQQGRSVRLAVSGTAAGESLPLYVRDHSAASLHKLGVQVLPYMRLYGSDADSVYLQHVSGGEAVVIEKVDALVLCTGHTPVDELSDTIEDLAIDIRIIGDAASPRTAEEAVYEGLSVAAEI